MKKSGDKDFLTVLQSLETILQAQTKISKKQLSSRTPNSKANSSPKKSNKKKMMRMDFQENDKNKEFNKIPPKSPSPKGPRKLYKNSKNKQLFMTPIKYSRNSSPKNQIKAHHTVSPQTIKNVLMHSPQSPIRQQKRRVRHNSPSDQIQYSNNTDDDPYLSQNYTSSQLNTLCIFFLRWMKRCTEKIEAESNRKSNSQSNQENTLYDKKSMKKVESNVQNNPSRIPKTLAESDEISIERIKCNPNEKTNQIPFDKIEINITPKSFKSSHPSSFNSDQKSNKKSDGKKKNSSKVKFNPALTPQQEKQYIEYLHPNHRTNHSAGNSPATNNKNNQKKISSRKIKDNDIEIENAKNRNNANNISDQNNVHNNTGIQQASINSTNKNTNDDDKNTNIDNNNTNENIKNNSSNSENLTKNNIKYDNQDTDNNAVNANSNNINQNSSTSNANLDSTEDMCKLDLEETSPLPKPNDVRKMPSIGESDLNNQPNSEDIHYDSYELSEKSLSLLPPQGEGEVTDFNPSNL